MLKTANEGGLLQDSTKGMLNSANGIVEINNSLVENSMGKNNKVLYI